MPTEIIIPRRRHRRHSYVGHRAPSYSVSAQTYVTGPATGMQYATTVPVATTPYVAPAATPMVATTPLVAQPQAVNVAPTQTFQTVQPTAVSAIATTPMVTTNALPRPLSAPPIAPLGAGTVYGDPIGMGGVGYAGNGYPTAYRDDYGYGGTYGARPGYDVGYGYAGGGVYDGRYSGGYGYPQAGMGSAQEYYGDAGVRAPFNQRVAEQLGGYLVDSPDMVAKGYARRSGYPVMPSTAQDAARRGMVGYGGARYVPGVGATYL